MSKIETAGRYPATVTNAEFGETETGTPYLYLALATDAGGLISAWLYLSEKAMPNTLKTLRDAFGFDGNFETAVDQVVNKRCSITVEPEEYQGKERMKVKWINPLRTNTPISDQSTFLKSLSAKAARIPAKATPAAAPTRSTPAARLSPAPVRSAAPVADEDVPF